MRGAQKIRRTAVGAQACQTNMLYIQQKIPVVSTLGGGQQSQRIKDPHMASNFVTPCGAMLALFFALGRFLGVFCASCCLCCRSWPVLLRLGALRAGFWKGLGRSAEGFGASRAIVLEVFSCTYACNAKNLRMRQNQSFSQVFPMF